MEVFNVEKKKTAEVELDPQIFGGPIRKHLFYEVVKSQLACRRQGTASTKTRGLLRGGGRKPWRQKGTGRARAGSTRSPIWRGGGTVFGPLPRDYSYRVPKKVRRAALRSALSLFAKEGRLVVLDCFELEEIKSKRVLEVLERFGIRDALVVLEGPNDKLQKSARNIPTVKVLLAEGLNVFDILNHEHLVIIRAALEKVSGALKA